MKQTNKKKTNKEKNHFPGKPVLGHFYWCHLKWLVPKISGKKKSPMNLTPATEINCKLMMYDLKLQVPAAFLYWHLLGRQEEINSSNTKTSNSCFKTRDCMQTTIIKLWFLFCITKKDTWFTFAIPWTLCYSHLCSPSTWPPFSTSSLHFLFM